MRAKWGYRHPEFRRYSVDVCPASQQRPLFRFAFSLPSVTNGKHSVFNVSRTKLLGLLDEAWIKRGSPLANDPAAYVIPMGRTVGTAGEKSIKMIVRPGTCEVITAYPVC